MLRYKKLNYNFDNTDIHICQGVIYTFSESRVWIALHICSLSLGGAKRLFGHMKNWNKYKS